MCFPCLVKGDGFRPEVGDTCPPVAAGFLGSSPFHQFRATIMHWVKIRSIHLCRWCACVLITLVLLCGHLSALDPAHAISQYAHFSWTHQDGQVPGSIFALAQTKDGNLWIGTESGLLRFDGVRFLPWRPPAGQQLSSDYINALAAARDGSLWIGTRVGLSQWKGGKLDNYRTSTGPLGPGVTAVLEDRDGVVWAGVDGFGSGRLCKVEGAQLHCYTTADGFPSLRVHSLFEDRLGNLWVGSLGGLSRWKPGAPRVYPLRESLGAIRSIVEESHGEIWVSTGRENGLQRLEAGRLDAFHFSSPEQNIQASVLLSDRNGGLWIGTFGRGLLHLHEGRIDGFSHADGLSSDIVFGLFEDHEGDVWAATDGGLDRFRDFAVTTISKRQGLSEDTVGSVFATKDGGIWIGTRGGLDRLLDGRITAYGKRDGLPSDNILGIFEEQTGGLWVDTSAGLAYFEHDRFFEVNPPIGPKMRNVIAVTEDSDHNVWFSDAEQGLIRFRDGHFTGVVPWSQFGNSLARALQADPKSKGLWLGLAQGGIAYYKPGHTPRWYTTADGLGRGEVTDLYLAPDSTLWIATEGGLSRLRDGHIATLTVTSGLPCNRIHAMVEDNDGALWLYTACGLVRITRSDLAAWSADPRRKPGVRLFDASDGMRARPISIGYFRRAAKSNDDRLWFAVMDGVVVVDPRHLPQNRVAPPVQIELITADRAVYPIHASLTLPPLTKELQIDYTALSFVAPEKVRFRYRLDGFDNDWKDAGGRRQALYTNLPPRHYQFRVIACNNDGVWNQTGASLAFSLQPALYQTTWFRMLCAAASALLLWSLYRLRLRRIAAQMSLRFEERLSERTRIANELHDTLLQNIAGFALQLDGLSKIVASPGSAKQRLRVLREEAEQWLREARESVWDLRSPTLESLDLLAAVRRIGEQVTAGQPVQFQVIVTGSGRRPPPALEAQLLRIVQEAIRNAVHHGQAKEIMIHLAYLNANVLQVQIRDDGCGFVLEEASRMTGHWGLAAMRERAQKIGAEFNIVTAPGHGSTIDIVVPVKPRPE